MSSSSRFVTDMATIIFVVMFVYMTQPADCIIYFSRVPTDQTVREGETVTFHCTVGDKGDTYVYWQKNKNVYLSRDRNVTLYSSIHPELTKRLTIVGRKNGKFALKIYDVKLHDEGIYQCLYFNENMFSSYTPPARLTVIPKRSLTLSCGSTYYETRNGTDLTDIERIDSKVHLTCEEHFYENQQKLSNLSWYRQDNPFHLFTPQYCITTPGSQKCVYVTPISKYDLDVPYICVKNGLTLNKHDMCQTRPFNSSIKVNVSSERPVHVGDSVRFLCLAADYVSVIEYEWYVNGKPVEYQSDGVVYRLNVDRITIESINQADNGTTLTCVLKSANGALGKGNAVLLVQGNDKPINNVIRDTTESTYFTTNLKTHIVTSSITATNSAHGLTQTITGAPRTSPKLSTGKVTIRLGRSRAEIMATESSGEHGVFSPRNTSSIEDDELDYNVMATSSMEVMYTVTTPSTDNEYNEWWEGLNNFYLVIAVSAVIFAGMCLLVLCNIVCYIAYKKHKKWKKRKNNRRYPLDQIRPGLDDSVMLSKLSPNTRRKQKQPVATYLSDTDGKQIPSPQSSRKADIILHSADDVDSEPVFFINSSSESGSLSRPSSRRNRSMRKLPSAPRISENSETCVEIEYNPYKLLDPTRSESLIESVKQKELEEKLEIENNSKSLKGRNVSSSSSESCETPPSYKDQINARRKCVSLNYGVKPWSQKEFDENGEPAYAVVNLTGHMRTSKSFVHNRPRSAFEPRPKHQRKSTRSLYDPPIRIKSSKRPLSPKYDNFRRQPAPIPAPRKPARIPQPSTNDSSHYDNFRSAVAASGLEIPYKPNRSQDVIYPHSSSSDDDGFSTACTKKADWKMDSSCALNLSHSEPELDHMHSKRFFADQPLPVIPMSPANIENEVFDYSEHAERRLSGESGRPFVHRQRSFSDSFTGKDAHCALDVIRETYTGIEPLSTNSSRSSSESKLDLLPLKSQTEKSPELLKKVLLRQKKLAEKSIRAARPLSEPVNRSDFDRVYPRLSDPASDEESLTAFPPYRP